MRVKGSVLLIGLVLSMVAYKDLRACAWDLRIIGLGAKPATHLILSNIKGSLDYIHAHPGSDKGSPEEIKTNLEHLTKAHQQLINALRDLRSTTWTATLAQQIFSEFADRILMSDAFIKSLRFVESRRRFSEEVWEVWDDDLEAIAKLIDKNLSKEGAEATAARKVLGFWGQPNNYWSMRLNMHCLRLLGIGETENSIYLNWVKYRTDIRRSTEHFAKVWKGLSAFSGELVLEGASSLTKPAVTEAPAVPTSEPGRIGSGSLVDPELEDEIDAAAGKGSFDRPKKDSGIRKPGANRTDKQKTLFMSAAERKKAAGTPVSLSKMEPRKKPGSGPTPPPAKP